MPEAELKRRNEAAALVDWVLATDPGSATGVSEPVVEPVLRERVDIPLSDLQDQLVGFEALVDQVAGAPGVLTFTFVNGAVELVWVRVIGGIGRASPVAAVVPTASKGVYCAADEPTPITCLTSQVAVYAPAGATVCVWGFRR